MLQVSSENLRRSLAGLLLMVFFLGGLAAQGQSLGDIARENQEKKAADSTATPPKLFTNADLPKNPDGYTEPPAGENEEQPAQTPSTASASRRAAQQRAADRRASEQWKRQIQAQKNLIANQQARVDQLRSQIYFVDPNASYDYYASAAYNRGQARLMQLLHQMEQHLDAQKHKLEEMQEAARRAGMHTTVYDP